MTAAGLLAGLLLFAFVGEPIRPSRRMHVAPRSRPRPRRHPVVPRPVGPLRHRCGRRGPRVRSRPRRRPGQPGARRALGRRGPLDPWRVHGMGGCTSRPHARPAARRVRARRPHPPLRAPARRFRDVPAPSTRSAPGCTSIASCRRRGLMDAASSHGASPRSCLSASCSARSGRERERRNAAGAPSPARSRHRIWLPLIGEFVPFTTSCAWSLVRTLSVTAPVSTLLRISIPNPFPTPAEVSPRRCLSP